MQELTATASELSSTSRAKRLDSFLARSFCRIAIDGKGYANAPLYSSDKGLGEFRVR